MSDINVNVRDNYGYMPLHWAARKSENPAVAELLINNGADVNARDKDGETPLHQAVKFLWNFSSERTPTIIMALLKSGANPKAKDNDEKTPYDYARENEKLKDTEALQALRDAQ